MSDAGAEIGIEFGIGDRVHLKDVEVGGMITSRMACRDVKYRFGVEWDNDRFSWHTPDEIEPEEPTLQSALDAGVP